MRKARLIAVLDSTRVFVTLCGAALFFGAPVAKAAPPDAPVVTTEATPRAPSNEAPPSESDALTLALERALAAYGAQRWAEAAEAFEKAETLATVNAEKASLLFNAAVARYQAAEFAKAEQLFRASGELAPETRSLAEAHAGLAAIARGDILSAESHLALVALDDPSSREKAEELRRAIKAAREAAASERSRIALDRAIRAYATGDRALTGKLLDDFARDRSSATADEQTSAELLRAYLAHDAEDLKSAEKHYRAVLDHEPKHFEALIGLGDLASAKGAPSLALVSYEQAKRAAKTAEQKSTATQRIERTYPVPSSKWYLSGEASFGYDSNAAQSGASRAVGFTGVAAVASPFLNLSLNVERPLRLAPTFALSPFYGGTASLLFESTVSDYSLQGHELGVLGYLALSPKNLLRLGVSGEVYFTGLASFTPFVADAWTGAQLTLHHSDSAQTRFSLDARRIFGLDGRDALSGHRIDLSARETLNFGSVRPFLDLSYTGNELGTSILSLREVTIPLCDGPLNPDAQAVCAGGGLYYIPLGYRGLALALGTEYRPLDSLKFGLSGKLEGRRYLGDSYIVVDPAGLGSAGPSELNRKTRVDVRFELRASAEITLDRGKHFSIPVDYWLLQSRSNIAQTEGGLEHALDYDDRNFTQHVISSGFRAAF